MSGTRGDLMLMGRVIASVELLGRTGVSNVEFAYDKDDRYPEGVLWWAKGNWQGHRVYSAHFPYPAQALEDVLAKVINGGACGRCERTTVVSLEIDGPYCCFLLGADDVDDENTYRYLRTCEARTVDDPSHAETEKLMAKVPRMRAVAEQMAASLVNAHAYVADRRCSGQITLALQAYYDEVDRD